MERQLHEREPIPEVAMVSSQNEIRWQARLTGAMYIPYLAFGLGLFARTPLIAPNDAAATAANILRYETLYRLTVITDAVSYALYIVLAYLFYLLLREVNRHWAAVGALFTVAGCVVLLLSTALLTAPLLLLDGAAFHAVVTAERQELALFAIRLFGQVYTIGLFLFGLQWLVMGPLFAASKLVPRVIGYWLFAGGIGWVALAVATLLGSPLRASIQAIVLPVAGLAEVALGIWLLFFAGWRAAAADVHAQPA
jgi:hypothetical protein